MTDISETIEAIESTEIVETAGTVEIVSQAIKKMYNEIADIEIANSMEKVRVILGFAPDDYTIKRMKDNYIKNNILSFKLKLISMIK